VSACVACQGFTPDQIHAERFLNLRYAGTDVAVMTACPPGSDVAAAFETAYKYARQCC